MLDVMTYLVDNALRRFTTVQLQYEQMHWQNTPINSRMLSDWRCIGQHAGTGASLCKGGPAQSPGERAICYRDRASRWHARLFSGEGGRISRRSGEPVEGAYQHPLARTHFAEPYGWRSLRHTESDPARQIVSL